ncbi:Pogo transposable element with ZNF domain [Merluccius polli]|uniref:Pogo transposable element with ZNF domain n=1 Tax=Merluccius polli TaxID=89951 RepID=A0AA47M0C5_MERPO|nr:Pogo transposable element with ZNF domain [Merluccius polli]
MSSELYMECEEEELEPWQREVSDEVEEMDVVCGLKQETEFVNGPSLAVPTPPPPTMLQAVPLIGSSFAQGVSVFGSNRSQGFSLIGSSVTQGTSVIGSNLAPGQPLILTQGPGGTFFLSTGQLSTAHGQIPGSAPNQPLLFTTQSLVPIQNSGNTLPKLLLNLQPGQTMQPLTLIQQQPVVRAKIAPKDHGYTLVQSASVTTPPEAPPISHTPTTLSPSTPIVAPRCHTPTPVSRTTTATPGHHTPTPTSLFTTPKASPSPYTPTPTSLFTTAKASPSPYTPTQASPKKVISKKPIAITTESATLAPPLPLRVVMTVGEFYYGVFVGNQSLQRRVPCKLSNSIQCKKCTFSTKRNMEMMRHYWQHTDMACCMQHEAMRCNECYRRFSSPDLLETHQQHAHCSTPSSTVCRICEWVFDNEMEFLNHMKANHKPGELPYICQVCSYRSSFYSDVLQHFTCYHAGSRYLLCILCLKVTNNNFFFQQHLNKHKLKEDHPCVKCRLQFIHPKDLLEHKQQHHRSFRRPHQLSGLPPGAMVTIKTTGMNNKSLPLPSRFHSATNLFKPIVAPPQRQPVPIESSLSDPTLPGSAPNTLLGLSENHP